mmetsp:Transcript_29866/g.74741  ORF Transcript_29866/g.74741 Transcript_29866/m.74741 type:complete len:206 (-) Transcript_29866:927-1544(-)
MNPRRPVRAKRNVGAFAARWPASISSVGHQGNECSKAPGQVMPGPSNSTAPTATPSEIAAVEKLLAAPSSPFQEPSARHWSGLEDTTPAHESCESPPKMTTLLAWGITAARNRRRSAAYPCQSSKFQFRRYRPSASSPRAASTGTWRPPTPTAAPAPLTTNPLTPPLTPPLAPLVPLVLLPLQSVHALTAAVQLACPSGGVLPTL